MSNKKELFEKLEKLLDKKIQIFDQIYKLTLEQSKSVPEVSNTFDVEESIVDAFGDYIDKKEVLILQLTSVDEQLDKLLAENEQQTTIEMEAHRQELDKIATHVATLNKLSDKIKSLELRNKKKFDAFLASHNKNVQQFKSTKTVASKYTQNMPDYHQSDMSYFLDKKK